ncbi:MAG: hypothetical protein LBJ03_00585 [Holosporales bacterium]|nr:hypothetical protein [Holosporales bacterium]
MQIRPTDAATALDVVLKQYEHTTIVRGVVVGQHNDVVTRQDVVLVRHNEASPSDFTFPLPNHHEAKLARLAEEVEDKTQVFFAYLEDGSLAKKALSVCLRHLTSGPYSVLISSSGVHVAIGDIFSAVPDLRCLEDPTNEVRQALLLKSQMSAVQAVVSTILRKVDPEGAFIEANPETVNKIQSSCMILLARVASASIQDNRAASNWLDYLRGFRNEVPSLPTSPGILGDLVGGFGFF